MVFHLKLEFKKNTLKIKRINNKMKNNRTRNNIQQKIEKINQEKNIFIKIIMVDQF